MEEFHKYVDKHEEKNSLKKSQKRIVASGNLLRSSSSGSKGKLISEVVHIDLKRPLKQSVIIEEVTPCGGWHSREPSPEPRARLAKITSPM